MDRSEALLEAARRHLLNGRFREAELLVRGLLAADAQQAEAWYLLARVANAARQEEEAIRLLRRATELAPGCARYYNELGGLYQDQGDPDAAAQCFAEAIRLEPAYSIAHCNLAEVYKATGKISAAIASYRTALSHQADFPACQSNLLMTLNYCPDIGAAELLAEHLRWGKPQGPAGPRPQIYANRPDPRRPLRIGYVSPDFQWHAVMRFFEPILAHHDQRRFEIVLYSEVPGGDEVTARLRKMAATTYRTVGRRAVEVAAQVREDEIDILVDLAGHTGHNRLDLFALKPAPVQVSYLGYCHTTGLPTVDYRIVDDVLEPQAAATAGTEQLVRIPGGFSCFQPPAGAPEVAPSPLVKTGRVTFGSHHGMPKLSAPLLETWRRLLDALPESRLLLQRPCNAAGVRILRERLTHYGIPDGRFEIRSTSRDEKQYLGAYADVDIVLDSFPFSGHTTTCEALWMGVPVITLCGDRPSARLSSSVLTALGHPEWIASDPQQYIELCVGLSRDPHRLATLRRELRRQMQQRLCDGAAFTARLEGAFRTLWEAWCLSQGARLPRVSSQCDLSSAKGYFDARRFHEAEVLLRRIVSDDPFYADAYCLLGMVALAAERHGDAAGLIRQAIALRPQRSDFHESHWNIVRELPDAGQKETALRQAVELASRCPEAYENLGMFFKEEGRDAESAAWFADAVAIRRGRGQ